MCTRVLCTGEVVKDNAFYSICGRNMDWGEPMGERLWVFPVGLKRIGLKGEREGQGTGQSAATWESQYGSMVTSVATSSSMNGDLAIADGMNTEGLAIHANWLTETYYGERDETRPGLETDIAVLYFLDQFATVQQVVEHLRNKEENKMQFVATKIIKPNGTADVTCHLAVEDAQGESAIIEFLKSESGGVNIDIYYSGDLPDEDNDPIPMKLKYNVLTNSPPFQKQLENIDRYKKLFEKGEPQEEEDVKEVTDVLPGGTDSKHRFVRGAFYSKNLRQPKNQREAIAGVLSVMRSAAQPFRNPDPARPYASQTQWRTVADLTEKLYLYESCLYPNLIWLDAKKIDFKKGSGVRVFDLTVKENRDVNGDVSDELESANDPFGNNVSK